jgi:hypothetical protein
MSSSGSLTEAGPGGIGTSPPGAGFGLSSTTLSRAMGTLTTGVFLAGFAVELGAPSLAIGVLAAVPFFVQLLQIPAVLLVERLRARRDLCAWTAGIGRCFLLGAAAAPLFGTPTSIVVLIGSLTIYQGMAAIGGCAWNSWMRDLVPPEQYARFFGGRLLPQPPLRSWVDHGRLENANSRPGDLWLFLFVRAWRALRVYRRASPPPHPRLSYGA